MPSLTVVGRYLTLNRRQAIANGLFYFVPPVPLPAQTEITIVQPSRHDGGDFTFTLYSSVDTALTYTYVEALNGVTRSLSITIAAGMTGENYIADLAGWVDPSHVYLTTPTVLDAVSGGGDSGGGPLLPGSVQLSNLAFDPATQAELDVVATRAQAAANDAAAALTGLSSAVNYGTLPAGTVLQITKSGGVWPNRPTSRADLIFEWVGPTPDPAVVTTGSAGMLSNSDRRLVTP
jgi:hypothetical protein